MKRYAKQISIGVCVIAVLCLVYWWGGNAPSLRGWQTKRSAPPMTDAAPDASVESDKPKQAEESEQPQANEQTEKADKKADDGEKSTQKAAQSAVENGQAPPKGKNQPSEDRLPPELKGETLHPPKKSDTPLECTVSIRCDTVLRHMDWLAPEKHGLVPRDGVILAEQTVTFYEGESVFNLLLRETKKHKIHMEFVNTPIYKSAYIEGIANLYEFDCGELSGWMYRVNGEFPNYGCSRYILHEGDRVEWVYTCDLGADVGGAASGGGQRDE